jgi:hypothetical protein
MKSLSQLHTKLDRAQAEIDKGVGNLVQHRAFIANGIAGGKDLTPSRELLVMLEDTQLLNVQHRDRLMREMDLAVALKNGPAFGAAALVALARTLQRS